MARNHVERRVTLVFSNPHHELQLVEATGHIMFSMDEQGKPSAMADLELVEENTRLRISRGDWPGIQNEGLDLVGMLVACDDRLNKGRIIWLKDDIEDRERRHVRERVAERNS